MKPGILYLADQMHLMRSLFILLMVLGILGGCKKKEEEKEPSKGIVPPGTRKKVRSLVMYDTLKTRQISSTEFEYDQNSGRLSRSVTSYTNGPDSSSNIKTYAYTSFDKVDSYTETAAGTSFTTTSILRFVYDTQHLPVSELSISLPDMYTRTTATYTRNGYTFIRTVNHDDINFTKYYLNRGDLSYYTNDRKNAYYDVKVVQYTYHSSMVDKSKFFFNETAPVDGECKLLVAEYYPSSILNAVPKTVTYSYVFDGDGHPVEYSNSEGVKWLVTYY